MISFAASVSTSAMFVIQVVNFKRDSREGLGGDYSREAIILNISVKGGLLF